HTAILIRRGGQGVRRATMLLLLLACAAIPSRCEVVATATEGILDLTQCYEMAKKQSETLQLSVEQIRQIEQQYKETLANALPNLTLNGSQEWQERNPLVGGTFSTTSKPQVNFVLTQPLFSGFREYAA